MSFSSPAKTVTHSANARFVLAVPKDFFVDREILCAGSKPDALAFSVCDPNGPGADKAGKQESRGGLKRLPKPKDLPMPAEKHPQLRGHPFAQHLSQ